MANGIKWLVLVLAGAVLSALVQPHIEMLLDRAGWYESPGGMAMNWLESIVGSGAFPWVAGGALGVAVGVWVDYLARRFDRNRQIERDEIAAIAEDMYERSIKIMRSKWTMSETSFAALTTHVDAVFAVLRKRGFVVPWVELADERDFYLKGVVAYFLTLGPMLRLGLISEAKVAARRVAEDIVSTKVDKLTEDQKKPAG